MGSPSPTYQSTAGGTSLSAGDIVWIFIRTESSNQWPYNGNITRMDFYVKATQPVPGTDTPVLTHDIGTGQTPSELFFFADGVDSRFREFVISNVPMSVVAPPATDLGPKSTPVIVQTVANRQPAAVVYLGTDDISDRDDDDLL